MNDTLSVIKSRRSIRQYSNGPLSSEDLLQILEAGQYAPSAMNEQPWHFTVITNKEVLSQLNAVCIDILSRSGSEAVQKRLSGKSPSELNLFYHAPVLIVVSGDTAAIAPQADGALAMENMFLAAESLNIGSCWMHVLNHLFAVPEGKDFLIEQGIIPAGNTIVGSAVFGHKADKSPTAPPRKENTVSYID